MADRDPAPCIMGGFAEDALLAGTVTRAHGDVDCEAPAGYRLRMPTETYSHPPVELDGISVRVVSPLAVYQLRAGIARQGSFGALSAQQLESMRLLRERFFPGRTEAELVPPTEPLR
jgi:hypothetical protein